MRIVCLADNSHEMLSLIFLEKLKIQMWSVAVMTGA